MKWFKHIITLLLVVLVARDVSSIYKSCKKKYQEDVKWYNKIQKLKKSNPGWSGKYEFIRSSYKIIGLDLSCKVKKSNLSDLTALKGLPIQKLILTSCDVKELEFVKGMPIEFLDISYTPIDSLEQLATVPIKELFARGSKITDIAPLKNSKLIGLWLSDTQVDDLTPLEGVRFEYLIISNTPAAQKTIPQGIIVKNLIK